MYKGQRPSSEAAEFIYLIGGLFKCRSLECSCANPAFVFKDSFVGVFFFFFFVLAGLFSRLAWTIPGLDVRKRRHKRPLTVDPEML